MFFLHMRDLTGLRQGRLTVLSCTGNDRWTVRCDCGTVFETSGQSLRQGTRSCGCLHRENVSRRLTKDEAGKRYGRLAVVGRASGIGNANGVHWLCRCDCGRERTVRGGVLRSGLAKDCGKGCPLRKEEGHGKE